MPGRPLTISGADVRDVLLLTRAAHQRLDRAGVEYQSAPIPWHIARTTTLASRPWPSRPAPKERTDA
jgi:hypothetical protein